MFDELTSYAEKKGITRNSLICVILSEWIETEKSKEKMMSQENISSMMADILLKSGMANKYLEKESEKENQMIDFSFFKKDR